MLLVFHPALQGELLCWDDDINISANPHITGLGWEQIRWSLTDTKYYWRFQPLAWLTWNTLYQITGSKPFLYHFVVVVLYAASAVLVFLLIEKLLRLSQPNRRGETPRSVTAVALLATALWAFHPMRVEAVAWAVELVYVMPLFFLLLSLLTYLRAADADVAGGKYYWLSVLCFAASLFTFPIAIGGLLVFVALDICPLNRINLNPREWFKVSARRVWLEKLPFFALTLLATWLNVYARVYNVTRITQLPSLGAFNLFTRIMQGFYIWAYYVWKPLVPFHLTPVPMQLYDFHPLSAPFVGSAVFIIGLTIALFLLRRRWPVLFLVWLCHLALLVPMLGLSERPHFPSDRYSLAVSIGGVILLAGLFVRFWDNWQTRRIFVAVVGVLITALAVMSYRQTLLWQNNERFLRYVLASLPADTKGDPLRVSIHLRLAGYYL